MSDFKRGVKWFYGACQVSRDWGDFKINVQFQLGACQMVNFEINRMGAEGGTRVHVFISYIIKLNNNKNLAETWVGVAGGGLHIL